MLSKERQKVPPLATWLRSEKLLKLIGFAEQVRPVGLDLL
jgi:hypothetical protein